MSFRTWLLDKIIHLYRFIFRYSYNNQDAVALNNSLTDNENLSMWEYSHLYNYQKLNTCSLDENVDHTSILDSFCVYCNKKIEHDIELEIEGQKYIEISKIKCIYPRKDETNTKDLQPFHFACILKSFLQVICMFEATKNEKERDKIHYQIFRQVFKELNNVTTFFDLLRIFVNIRKSEIIYQKERINEGNQSKNIDLTVLNIFDKDFIQTFSVYFNYNPDASYIFDKSFMPLNEEETRCLNKYITFSDKEFIEVQDLYFCRFDSLKKKLYDQIISKGKKEIPKYILPVENQIDSVKAFQNVYCSIEANNNSNFLLNMMLYFLMGIITDIEQIPEIYKINALHYKAKKFETDDVVSCLRKNIHQYAYNSKFLTFISISLYVSNILDVEIEYQLIPIKTLFITCIHTEIKLIRPYLYELEAYFNRVKEFIFLERLTISDICDMDVTMNVLKLLLSKSPNLKSLKILNDFDHPKNYKNQLERVVYADVTNLEYSCDQCEPKFFSTLAYSFAKVTQLKISLYNLTYDIDSKKHQFKKLEIGYLEILRHPSSIYNIRSFISFLFVFSNVYSLTLVFNNSNLPDISANNKKNLKYQRIKEFTIENTIFTQKSLVELLNIMCNSLSLVVKNCRFLSKHLSYHDKSEKLRFEKITVIGDICNYIRHILQVLSCKTFIIGYNDYYIYVISSLQSYVHDFPGVDVVYIDFSKFNNSDRTVGRKVLENINMQNRKIPNKFIFSPDFSIN